MKLRKNAKIELIGKIPLFKHCSTRELGEIAAIADEIDLKEGKDLTSEGKSGREFFAWSRATPTSSRAGSGSTRWPGRLPGRDRAGHGPAANGDGEATTPVRVLVITDRDFRKLLEELRRSSARCCSRSPSGSRQTTL